MPLMPGKSKKAFSKNVATEMDAGKPMKQSLAIAYSVKGKKPKKMMAEGGAVSAKAEARPMPAQRFNDSRDLMQAPAPKAPAQSQWTDQPTVKQAMAAGRYKMNPTKPRISSSGAFSVRERGMFDDEKDLEASKAPASPMEQPPKADDEEGADRQGPAPHKMKMMAKGGKVEMEMGEGPEEDELEEPAGLESDDDEMAPAKDEFMADHFAEGGMAGGMDEEELERHASIAAAIMAKMDKMKQDSGSADEDAAEMYADGGMVDLKENAEEMPNAYYHQNEDEVLKENDDEDMWSVSQPMDSNEHGDDLKDEDDHEGGMVAAIRRKMKKSPIAR